MSLARGWRWEMLHPHQDDAQGVPCAREAPGAILAHDGQIYLFGGGALKYGLAERPGDLTVLGSMSDLWRYDAEAQVQTQLEADDGRVGFAYSEPRPCTRLLPAWVPVKDRLQLLGGISVLGPGWRPCILNDLWVYDPASCEWDLAEFHDGGALIAPDHVDATRPTTVAAMGAATLPGRIYLMGEWASSIPRFDSRSQRWSWFVMSPQLWCYDVQGRTWEHLGPSEAGQVWPVKRYCPALVGWQGRLQLWGGRDTDVPEQVFYNDLWEYALDAREWRCLQEHRRHDPDRPCPRYGLGSARIGHYWYLLGGFGSKSGSGPQFNNLWRCDLHSGKWECICAHNAAEDYTASVERPCVRRVPGMTALADAIYVFGGLELASGRDGPVSTSTAMAGTWLMRWRNCRVSTTFPSRMTSRG